MYLRTVQLGIQDLAGHPWLLHACAICAAILFLLMGFDAFSCCTAVLSLASARKNSRASTSVCGRSRLCSLSKSPEFSSNPREWISIVGVSESALDKITGCCSLWV